MATLCVAGAPPPPPPDPKKAKPVDRAFLLRRRKRQIRKQKKKVQAQRKQAQDDLDLNLQGTQDPASATSSNPSNPKRVRSKNPKYGKKQGSSTATAEITAPESGDMPSVACPGAGTEPHEESTDNAKPDPDSPGQDPTPMGSD